MQKVVMVTGATSGIGEAVVWRLARAGYNVVATGRRRQRLLDLERDVVAKYGVRFHLAEFDVRHQSECETAMRKLPSWAKPIHTLVNNAGLASGLDRMQHADPADWNKMIDTNVKGLLNMSRAVLDHGMLKAGAGHIINIGSTAGKEVYERGGVYCASKFAVDAITKGLRIDLLGTGIKVSQVCPGAVESEFSLVRFKGDRERAKAVYQGFTPLTPADVAEAVHFVATLPENVCVNDLVLTAANQASSHYIHRKV